MNPLPNGGREIASVVSLFCSAKRLRVCRCGIHAPFDRVLESGDRATSFSWFVSLPERGASRVGRNRRRCCFSSSLCPPPQPLRSPPTLTEMHFEPPLPPAVFSDTGVHKPKTVCETDTRLWSWCTDSCNSVGWSRMGAVSILSLAFPDL